MNFKEVLSTDSSRLVADIVANEVGNDAGKFNEVVSISLTEKPPVSWRAARIIDIVSEKHPGLFEPYVEMILKKFETSLQEGVKRSYLRIFTRLASKINDEDQLGILVDKCFEWIGSTHESIAVKAYSGKILYEISSRIPELKPELIAVFEAEIPQASSGLKNSYKNYHKKLNKKELKNSGYGSLK